MAKAKTINEVIKMLEEQKALVGDVEVFVVNMEEGCFDSLGNAAHVIGAGPGLNTESGYKALIITRGEEVLKIRL